ncbi:Vacuolar amino acid transporter 5 [Fusarium oxysporum f. sp. albedinis]|nr:Vacuolar amino acid transporter 5 [Fusarium oxysporum f. sp. albedinis]
MRHLQRLNVIVHVVQQARFHDKCARSIRLHATSAGKIIWFMLNSVTSSIRHCLYAHKACYFFGMVCVTDSVQAQFVLIV